MAVKLRPLGNKIIINLIEPPEEIVLPSGIVLPDYQGIRKANVQHAEVVAVHEGYYSAQGELIHSIVAVGDKIMVNPNAVFQIEITRTDIRTYINENDIVCVLSEEE